MNAGNGHLHDWWNDDHGRLIWNATVAEHGHEELLFTREQWAKRWQPGDNNKLIEAIRRDGGTWRARDKSDED